jgi:hypothetical protein
MKWIISRYNQDISYLPEYTSDYILYDRSEAPLPEAIVVPNIGTDLHDKFTYIIDNYDKLPDVAVYTKANLFKYVSKEEFDLVKDNTTFTPLLTQNHAEVLCDVNLCQQLGFTPPKSFSFYKDGMYYELNYPSYLKHHDLQNKYYQYADTYAQFPLLKILGIGKMEYVPFAPGSNYILPKENILKHSKEFYEELRSYLAWDRYPGEAMCIERALYTLWQ